MAKEKPSSFPMLPVTHWWTLREKFKQTMPGIVTDNYLATTLNVEVRSARANVLPYLRDIGLIDSEGKTQDLATKWRDDKQYSAVCESMRKGIYPQDLISAVDKPSDDREAVERWFANHTGAGSAAVKRMAAIYIVISEADLAKKPEPKVTKDAPRKKTKPTKSIPQARDSGSSADLSLGAKPPLSAPGVSINLEIHVSSDATPDQIDKIFESMAKHIYKK